MATRRPNILYCFTDQQHARALGCVNADLRTPAMDRIAAEGVRFDQAYCSSPLCTPSRASMFTGRMPCELGIVGNVKGLPESGRQHEMGWIFRNAGYRTAYAGKWHLPKQTMAEGHGFEVLCGMDDPLTTQRCVEFLQREADEPFLLVASFFQPHGCCPLHRYPDPRRCRGLGLGHYAPSTLSMPTGDFDWPSDADSDAFLARCPALPDNFAPAIGEPPGMERVRHETRSGGTRPAFWQAEEEWNAARTWNEDAFRHYLWGYNRLVEWADLQVARILAALDASGQADNTLVVFSSDHGDMLGSHRLTGKNVLYQEAVRIPLLMRWPGVIPEQTVVDDRLVSNGLDLLPTLCTAAGIAAPEHLRGRNLLALAQDPKTAWREDLVIECAGKMGAGRLLHSGQHAYIRYVDANSVCEELYDMAVDPGQTRNLVGEPRHQSLLDGLRLRLDQWQVAHGDPLATTALHTH